MPEKQLIQWILCFDCNSYLNEDAKRFKFDCIKGGGEIPFAGLFQDLDLKKYFDVAHLLQVNEDHLVGVVGNPHGEASYRLV